MLNLTRTRITGLFALCLISSHITLTFGSINNASAADEAFGELARFLPDTTETIIALHPQRIMDNEGSSWMIERGQLEDYFPKNLGNVETIVLAGSWETVSEMCAVNRTSKAFQQIADEIQNETVGPKTKPAIGNRLNEDFVGLVRFETPVSDQAVIDWLSGPHESDLEYARKTRGDREVFASKRRNTCMAVRVDANTIIVGGNSVVSSGLRTSGKRVQLAGFCNNKLNAAEMTIVFDMQKSVAQSTRRRSSVALYPGMSEFEKAKWISVALDFTGPEMVVVKAEMPNAKDAKLLADQFHRLHQQQLAMFALMATTNAGRDTDPGSTWMADKTLEIFQSVEIGASENQAELNLPRPKHWNETVRQYIDYQKAVAAEAKAAFEDVAKELEAANDATEKALSAFEDIAKELE